MLAQRLSEWSARAPELEEDLALTNIALDLLGQARTLLTRAGELEGDGPRRGRPRLPARRPRVPQRAQLVEQPNGDFARTIARQLLFSTYQLALYDRLLRLGRPGRLPASPAKAVKEVAYHRDHAREWTLRLGDGTEESHRRMQEGVDWMWPLRGRAVRARRAHRAPRRRGGRRRRARAAPGVGALVGGVLEEATLDRPDDALRGHRRASRRAHRGARPRARRDAVDAPRAPGGDVVSDRRAPARAGGRGARTRRSRSSRSRTSGSSATCPVDAGRLTVTLTPTYSGCPAIDPIRDAVAGCAADAGFDDVEVVLQLKPAWTTEWMSRGRPAQAARVRDRAAVGPRDRLPAHAAARSRCPRCGSQDTKLVTRFGATPCQAQYTCRDCREPFDHFKAH